MIWHYCRGDRTGFIRTWRERKLNSGCLIAAPPLFLPALWQGSHVELSPRRELIHWSLLCYFSWSRWEKKSRSDVGPIYHGSDRSSAAQHDRVGDQQGCVQSHHTWSERTQEETPWLWVYVCWYSVCCCHPASCRASEKQTYRSYVLTHSFTLTWQSGCPPGRAGVWRLIWSGQPDCCRQDTHEMYLPLWYLCRSLSVHLAVSYRILPVKGIWFVATSMVRIRPDFSLKTPILSGWICPESLSIMSSFAYTNTAGNHPDFSLKNTILSGLNCPNFPSKITGFGFHEHICRCPDFLSKISGLVPTKMAGNVSTSCQKYLVLSPKILLEFVLTSSWI